jgi:outer membrane receptor for ferrienterochelin and colicin
MEEFTEELEVRYSGIDNLLLYARGEWGQEEGDRWIREQLDAVVDMRVTDTETDSSKYTIGANWYPVQGLSLSAQYYYETMEQDFDYEVVDIAPLMNERSMDTHDVNFRLTWRARPNLTFVTRYDYQQTDFEQDPFKAGLGNVESGEITRHIISESVTWNATSRLYVQGSAHWISDNTETGYNYTVAGQEVSPDWDNDYWCATVNAGYALTDKSSLEAGIFYYAADNYVNNQLASMPYGAIVDEYMLTLGYVQQISPNMVWNIRYGFYNSEDDAVGGNNDFDAHMVSTGLQVRF